MLQSSFSLSNLSCNVDNGNGGKIVLEAAQIWRECAPHYFLADCFGNLEGTGSTLFSGGLFWRQLKLWELAPHCFPTDCFEDSLNLEGTAPHYFPTDCFGGSSNLEENGSTLFFDRLFWRQLKFGGNWLHIIF
jgi:hypothetical protein